MENIIIKERLQEYITKGDDRLLKLMYAVAKEYSAFEDDDYELTNEQLYELDKRTQKYKSGESKRYSWEEAKQIIIGKKNE